MALCHGGSGTHTHPPGWHGLMSRDPALVSVAHAGAKRCLQRQTLSFLLLKTRFQRLCVELQFVQSWRWRTCCWSMGRNAMPGRWKWEPKLRFLNFSWSPEPRCGFCRTSKRFRKKRCRRNKWYQTHLYINAWGLRASRGGRICLGASCKGRAVGPTTSAGWGGLVHAGILPASESSRKAMQILASEGWHRACCY